MEALERLDREGVGRDPARYEAIAEGMKQGLSTPFEMNRLFQVDMRKPAVTATLGERVIREILKGVEALHAMAGLRREDPLEGFARAFEERYGGREVPLLQALDEEWGVGFERAGGPGATASPLLAGVPLAGRPQPVQFDWTAREAHLWPLAEEAARSGLQEIELSDKDLEKLSLPGAPPLPDAFSVMATLASPSCDEVNRGNFRVWLHGASGPSGGNLLGRFCPMDEELTRKVRAHLRAEEALKPEALFAEIVHLPEGRIGNVIFRPPLRAYEIPFLGHSGFPRERQIPLQDLLVSVRGGRVVLRSRRLGREILPRLTTAHNYRAPSNLKAYRFLCLLQHQGVAAGLAWTWGPLERFSFLPRVRWGRVVFARARWRLSRETITHLCQGEGEARVERIRAWAAARGVPRLFYLAEGDNELLMDLDLPLAVDTFADYVKNRPEAVLVEMYPGPEELCVEGPEGRFVHELVVPFVGTEAAAEAAAAPRPAAVRAAPSASTAKSVQRAFPPGSEWLYAKLYCGPANADRLLMGLVAPLVRRALASKAAGGWFFIRYNDPDFHLRVRFHGAPQRLLLEVLPALKRHAEKALAEGLLHRLELATYEREVERYGGPEGVLLCEPLFQADSEAVVDLLSDLTGDEGAQARWKLALYGAQMLLRDLGLEDQETLALLSRLKEGYFQEFGGSPALKKALGDRYRRERAEVERLLETRESGAPQVARGLAALEERARKMRPVLATLLKKAKQGRLTTPLPDLAASLLHMHVNRLIRAEARAHEAVLYAFLAQAHESGLARRRWERRPAAAVGAAQ